MLQPFLKTQRLHLRNYRQEDWEQIHPYSADPEFSRYEVWGPNSEADTKKFISDCIHNASALNRFRYDFAMVHQETDLVIGGCNIRRETEKSIIGSVGWSTNPEFQKQGFATEAAQEMLRVGFHELGCIVIYATCDVGNVASEKVMQKIGMERVGLTVRARQAKGEWRDLLRYEISKEAYEKSLIKT